MMPQLRHSSPESVAESIPATDSGKGEWHSCGITSMGDCHTQDTLTHAHSLSHHHLFPSLYPSLFLSIINARREPLFSDRLFVHTAAPLYSPVQPFDAS